MSEQPGASGLSMAMHQPNYIPWIGYFFKMAEVDVFVYLDAVQYPRGRNFSARNRIKGPSGPIYLTVPVSIPSGNEGKASYLDVRFADQKWRAKHLKSLRLNYAKSPYFEEIFALLEPIIQESDTLVALNVALIETIADYLGIATRRCALSQLRDSFGQKTDLIVDLCESLDATRYVSGKGGGREYNDEALMAQHGITLEYSSFNHPRYPQLWGDFEQNLSIVDLLFNCGPDSGQILASARDPSL